MTARHRTEGTPMSTEPTTTEAAFFAAEDADAARHRREQIAEWAAAALAWSKREPVTPAPLDLEAAQRWLSMCGPCDVGVMGECTCPPGDYRSVLSEAINEIARLRDELAEYREDLGQHCGHIDSPCGCPHSPDPGQAYQGMRERRDALRAEVDAMQPVLAALLPLVAASKLSTAPRTPEYEAVIAAVDRLTPPVTASERRHANEPQ